MIKIEKESLKGLTKIACGFGWDIVGEDIDIDVSAFLTNKKGIVEDYENFIFYNNFKGEGIVIVGDSVEKEDKELIMIDLDKISKKVDRIVFTISVEYDKENNNLGQLENVYFRIVNEDNYEEVTRYKLGDFSDDDEITAVILTEIQRCRGGWELKVLGKGYYGGIEQLCSNFGI